MKTSVKKNTTRDYYLISINKIVNNHTIKVFLFILLLASTTLFPSVHFANAEGQLIIPKDSTVIIDTPVTADGLIIQQNATLIITKDGNLFVDGNFQNNGILNIDGKFQHNGFLFNFPPDGHIYERCATIINPGNIVYIIAGNGIERADCNDGSNVLPPEEDLIVDAGTTFTVDRNMILFLSGDVIIRGTFVNLGDIQNSATILMDGGSFRNAGNITHLCENFGISKFTGGASIQNVGTTGKTICSPPIAVDDLYSVDEDGKLVVDDVDLGVLENDDDVNDAGLTASVTITPTNPTSGTLEFESDGSHVSFPSSARQPSFHA